MIVAGYLAAVLMGATLGLIGGGGTILALPILVYLLDVEPVRATGYSLFVVGATALVGAVRYLRAGLVDGRATIVFGLPSLAGVYAVRRWLVPALPDELWSWGSFVVTKALFVMVVFAIVMALTAASMILSRRSDEDGAHPASPGALPLAALEGLVVGGVTGFVGAGGGFLIVPSLIFFLGLPVRSAIGTSLLVIAIKSILGFVGDLQASPGVEWGLVLAFSSLAVGGILAGAELNHRVPAARLKPMFGWFVLAMAAVILVQELS